MKWEYYDDNGKRVGEIKPVDESSPIGNVILVVVLFVIVVLFQWLNETQLPTRFVGLLVRASHIFIIGIIVGISIFVVSLKHEASIITAFLEAIFGALVYQLVINKLLFSLMEGEELPYLFGKHFLQFFSEFEDSISDTWLIIFWPFLTLLPLLLVSGALAIGSTKQSELRNHYLRLDNCLFKTCSVLVCAVSIIIINGETDKVITKVAFTILLTVWFSVSILLALLLKKVILKVSAYTG